MARHAIRDVVKKVLFTDNDNGDINVAFIGNKITNAGNNEGGGINIAILPRSNTGNCSASAA